MCKADITGLPERIANDRVTLTREFIGRNEEVGTVKIALGYLEK
jgi:hypothetical protein